MYLGSIGYELVEVKFALIISNKRSAGVQIGYGHIRGINGCLSLVMEDISVEYKDRRGWCPGWWRHTPDPCLNRGSVLVSCYRRDVPDADSSACVGVGCIGHAIVCLNRCSIDEPRHIHDLIDRDIEYLRRILGIADMRRERQISCDHRCSRCKRQIEIKYPAAIEIIRSYRVICGVYNRTISGNPLDHIASSNVCRIEDEFVIIVIGIRFSLPTHAGIRIGYINDRTLARSIALVADVPEYQKRCRRVLIINKPITRIDCAGSCDA